jgi:hypothetical protein
MELREFTKSEWMMFSGCEGEPLIAETETLYVIVDDTGAIVVYPWDELHESGEFLKLTCPKALAQSLVAGWPHVPFKEELVAMGFELGTW